MNHQTRECRHQVSRYSVSFIFVFCSCNLTEINVALGPVETLELSFHSYSIIFRLFTLAKTDTEICRTCSLVQTDSGKFAFFLWSTEQTSGGLHTCTKNMHKDWDANVSLILLFK